MNFVTGAKHALYERKFAEHGASAAGVGWGGDAAKNRRRYDNFLDILNLFPVSAPSLLDVGCGYGELRRIFRERDIPVAYTGIDVSQSMVSFARELHGDECLFHCGDFLEFSRESGTVYDYVVCNGILTDRQGVKQSEMERFFHEIVPAMFGIAKSAIAFNVMSTRVDYFGEHLFHKSPVETFAWCLEELSPLVELRHTWPRYEYTVYVGKPS